jgi:hypothetical protein
MLAGVNVIRYPKKKRTDNRLAWVTYCNKFERPIENLMKINQNKSPASCVLSSSIHKIFSSKTYVSHETFPLHAWNMKERQCSH